MQLKKLLVFQHIGCEHPGIFRDMLDEAGIQWDVVSLDSGDVVPALDDYDALWVMGVRWTSGTKRIARGSCQKKPRLSAGCWT